MELKGMIPPAVTPFDRGGNLDIEKHKREVEYLINYGIEGIGIAGSTGEGSALSDEEIAELISATRSVAGDGMPVIGGVIRNSTIEAIRSARVAREAGADALLVTPVPYSGATEAGNIQYFSAIAEDSGLPIIVYNVVPTNPVSPALMSRIAEIPGVIGVKQIDCEMLVSMVIECGDKTRIYSATDEMLVGSYMAGAIGAIAAIVTVVPDLCVRQWEAYKEGDLREAESLQRIIAPIVKSYASRPFPGKVKELINLQEGRDVGYPRAPVLPPEGEEKERIRAVMLAAP